jgi:hypothetical protein
VEEGDTSFIKIKTPVKETVRNEIPTAGKKDKLISGDGNLVNRGDNITISGDSNIIISGIFDSKITIVNSSDDTNRDDMLFESNEWPEAVAQKKLIDKFFTHSSKRKLQILKKCFGKTRFEAIVLIYLLRNHCDMTDEQYHELRDQLFDWISKGELKQIMHHPYLHKEAIVSVLYDGLLSYRSGEISNAAIMFELN